jgi:ABC-type amino acid transport substrate-binding protein
MRAAALAALLGALTLLPHAAARQPWRLRGGSGGSGAAAAARRGLRVWSEPSDADPRTVPRNKKLRAASPDLPYDDPRIAKGTLGCEPEQVRGGGRRQAAGRDPAHVPMHMAWQTRAPLIT